jgi:hypothetical protein
MNRIEPAQKGGQAPSDREQRDEYDGGTDEVPNK